MTKLRHCRHLISFPILGKSEMAASARGGDTFDFTPRNVYGNQDFYKTVVKGPGDLRQVVETQLVHGNEPYMASLFGLTLDGYVILSTKITSTFISLSLSWYS